MFYKLIMVIFVVLSVSACQEKDAASQKTTPSTNKDYYFGPVSNKNTKRVRTTEEITQDRIKKQHERDEKAKGSEK